MDLNHEQDSMNLSTGNPESVTSVPEEHFDKPENDGEPIAITEAIRQEDACCAQAPVAHPANAQMPTGGFTPAQAPTEGHTDTQMPTAGFSPAQAPTESHTDTQMPSGGFTPAQAPTGSNAAPQGGAVIHGAPYIPQRAGMTPPPYTPPTYTPHTAPVYPGYPGAVPPHDGKPKKTKKNGSRGTGWIVVLCIVLSFLCGFGGIVFGLSISERRQAPPAQEPDETRVPVDSNESGDVTLPSGSELTEADPDNTKILSVKGVYAQNADAVVEIVTEYITYFFRNENTSEGAGSGVILTQDGYIVTNYHVIDSADTVHVRLKNGDYYEATVIGADADSDIAVLKIDASGLTVAVLGDSSKIEIGDLCVAIGNPLGTLGGTVTDGIISALDREITIDGETMRLLQHNAAVSPGNSGGGLFNENGDLIGIVNAKSSGSGVEGIGFAIPINSVKNIINDLVTDGYVHGKFKLGLNLVNISDQRSASYYNVSEYGIYISEVAANSNAELAGLKSGDLVRTINGEQITAFEQIEEILANSKAGDVLTFVVDRDGNDMEIPVTLHEYIPKDVAA